MRKRLVGLLALTVSCVLLGVACAGGGGSHKNSLAGKITVGTAAFKHGTVSLGSTKKKGGPTTNTKTDAAGRYSFLNVPAGSYMLSFAFRVSNGTCVVVGGVKVEEQGDQTMDFAISESDLENLMSGFGLTSGGAVIRCK